MSRKQRIETILSEKFRPTHLEVEDQSSRHAGHAGARPEGETHYKVTIVSEAFKNLSRIETQRQVNKALDEEFRTGLHALSISAKEK